MLRQPRVPSILPLGVTENIYTTLELADLTAVSEGLTPDKPHVNVTTTHSVNAELAYPFVTNVQSVKDKVTRMVATSQVRCLPKQPPTRPRCSTTLTTTTLDTGADVHVIGELPS